MAGRPCYLIKSRLNGYVLTVQGLASSIAVVLRKQLATNHNTQLWYDDYATGTIRSVYNNLCLDVEGQFIVLKPYQDKNSCQLWEKHEAFVRRSTSQNLVLAVSAAAEVEGSRIVVAIKTGWDDQQFDFLPVEDAEVERKQIPAQLSSLPQQTSNSSSRTNKKPFYIISHMNCKALTVKDGNPVPGTPVVMWDKKYGSEALCQLWCTDDDDVIRSALNNFVMDPCSNGSKIVMTIPSPQNYRQRWKLSDGIKIVNDAFECLDIRGENKKNGAEVIPYRYKNGSNQHWRLEYA